MEVLKWRARMSRWNVEELENICIREMTSGKCVAEDAA